MAKSDLLKQAIADARAVKETALANAKIALQESFYPTVTRMLENELEQELENEMEDPMATQEGMYGEGMYEEEDMDMDAGADMDAEAGAAEGEDDFTWTDDSLSASVGGQEYNFQVGMAGGEEEEMAASAPAAGGDEFEEGGEEDLNLESLIRELEMDADAMATEGDAIEPDIDVETEGMYGEGMYNEQDDEMMPEPTDESYIDEIIESILREESGEPEGEDDMAAKLEQTEDELEDTKQQVQEAYRTVRYLKNIINEVNLLNAKLLYTNKLFRNFELNEGQKMKVIENFDRAGTTREVKLVFTTLAESFKRPTKKRVVRESYASRPVASTAPRTAPILNEGFELADRWKKLAGLL